MYRVPGGTACLPCGPGFHKADIGDEACTPCSENEITPERATDESQCGTCELLIQIQVMKIVFH